MPHRCEDQDTIQQLAQALGLPKGTVAFTLRARADALATVEAEYILEQSAGAKVCTLLKHYRLQEITAPTATNNTDLQRATERNNHPSDE